MTYGRLYRQALESIEGDMHGGLRDRLRVALSLCKERCDLLSEDISRDLPSFTMHNALHTDELWDIADEISGPDYFLTPIEGFVFGCAVLIHDLAMTKNVYAADHFSVYENARWRDILHNQYLNTVGLRPTVDELAEAPSEVVGHAMAIYLRELHAEQSSALPFLELPIRGVEFHLIDDAELRVWFGNLIGKIAASHWWDENSLLSEFQFPVGVPTTFPRDWQVDPLKISCLLRAADISHIDSSRVPTAVRAVRSLGDESARHWDFHSLLNRPYLDGDRLTYTSNSTFRASDAEAWWLCVDALKEIDRTLRSVDALLADNNRQRLLAKSVAHINDVNTLSRLIRTDGWFPVDARIQVSDLIGLVSTLGGSALYGDRPDVALRELVMNSADAVRARRAVDESATDLRLRVVVEVQRVGGENWLVVEDNGLGMSLAVMSGPLLDFGKSHWSSSLARHENPGLLSSGFRPTGKFGIGFFSIFMLGSEVQVRSRRFDASQTETHVLEFRHGLATRPLVRVAQQHEVVRLGGTRVAVKVDSSVLSRLGLGDVESMRSTCAFEFPTLDVDLEVKDRDGSSAMAVRASDWATLSPRELQTRLISRSDAAQVTYQIEDKFIPSDIYSQGLLVGRVGLCSRTSRSKRRFDDRYPLGNVTIGGARSDSVMSGLVGYLVGRPSRAARDSATPVASVEEIARWASEQAVLVMKSNPSIADQLDMAATVCALKGDPGTLHVAKTSQGFLTVEQVEDWAAGLESVIIVDDSSVALALQHDEKLSEDDISRALHRNVLVADAGIPGVFDVRRSMHTPHWAPTIPPGESLQRFCARAVARGWGIEESAVMASFDGQVQKVQEFEESIDYGDERQSEYPGYRAYATLSNGERVSATTTFLFRRDDAASLV